MSNIRHTALFVPPPPFVEYGVRAHFDIRSDSTADPSQDTSASVFMEVISNLRSSSQKNQSGTAGLVARTSMMAHAQVNRFAPQLSPDCVLVFPYNRWNMLGHGSLTPSTEVSTFPATNTYKQQRSKIWRSTSKTASLTRDLGIALSFALVPSYPPGVLFALFLCYALSGYVFSAWSWANRRKNAARPLQD